MFTGRIAEQKAAGVTGGDHFAKPGANDRIWSALDKFALRDPAAFAAYYDNATLALISRAWLGTGYQVTSQVNVVNPGGRAQVSHRDYHLGFMSQEQAEQYPAHIHLLSPALTLQGAVAHVDMPVETGPTLYLPHSQKYAPGYVAFHQPEFTAMVSALYPVLRSYAGDVRNVVAASAEGYAFPTNLDRDQPIGGLAPQTQAELVLQALTEGWEPDRFAAALRDQQERRAF